MAKLLVQFFISTCAAALLFLVGDAALARPKSAAKPATKPESESQTVEGIRLKMRSDFYGDLDTTVSKIGMKFYSPRTGVNVVALPPDGRMYAYNADAKKIYKVDMRRFGLSSRSPTVTRGSAAGAYFATGKRAVVGGLNAVQFANFTAKDLPSLNSMRSRALLQGGSAEGVVVPCEIWAAADIVLPRTFMFILSKITQITEKELAQLYGKSTAKMVRAPVPLRVYRIREGGSKVLAVDTLASIKQKVSAKDFMPPAGLKSVPNEMALLMGEDDSFGFGGAGDQGKTASTQKTAGQRTMSDLSRELGITPMAKPQPLSKETAHDAAEKLGISPMAKPKK